MVDNYFAAISQKFIGNFLMEVNLFIFSNFREFRNINFPYLETFQILKLLQLFKFDTPKNIRKFQILEIRITFWKSGKFRKF